MECYNRFSPKRAFTQYYAGQGNCRSAEELLPDHSFAQRYRYRWPGRTDRMDKAEFTRSMSRKGCSPNNAACKDFSGHLKNELFRCFFHFLSCLQAKKLLWPDARAVFSTSSGPAFQQGPLSTFMHLRPSAMRLFSEKAHSPYAQCSYAQYPYIEHMTIIPCLDIVFTLAGPISFFSCGFRCLRHIPSI